MRKKVIAALISTTALVAVACRGDDGGSSGGSTAGVSEEPCEEGISVSEDRGCIKLGSLTDLTGPFSALAVPITEAQAAFWKTFNEEGGLTVGDKTYDVDVESNVKNTEYDPETHKQVFDEIKADVLGLAQTLGSPQTATIIDDLDGDNIVAAPASWSSEWTFQDVVLQSGAPYCIESMNAIDFAMDEYDIESVMAVHYAGDYGGDAAGGAEIAAEENDLQFWDVETKPGQDNQGAAIKEITSKKPDLVILTTPPTEAATIVGGAAAGDYEGKIIGTSPTWNPALLDTEAAPALEALYLQSGPWHTYDGDSEAHKKMREALGDVESENDGYTSGWIWQYPIRAALEKAAETGDLNRESFREAAESLTSVDYEGALPEGSGNFAGDPNDQVVRHNTISEIDQDAPTGVTVIEDFFVGPTAENFEFTEKCF